jgi:hypothetical protein
MHDVPGAGRVDRRSVDFDAAVARALADADPDALAMVDAGLAAELGATGRAAWQVAAAASAATVPAGGAASAATMFAGGAASATIGPAGDAATGAAGAEASEAVRAAVMRNAGGGWRGELLYSGAPYGVGYHVAVWERR